MRPVVYVLSEVSSAAYFEWLAESSLFEKRQLIFVLLNRASTSLEERLRKAGVRVIRIRYSGKRHLPVVLVRLIWLFARLRPEVVHTHLLAANLLGLTAAWITRVPRRIYTRHHLDINHIGPFYARIYDLVPNLLATRIIATCENVRRFLVENERVPRERVSTVRFGFPDTMAVSAPPDRVECLKEKYSLQGKFPVVGVISRYVAYKGIPHVAAAFQEILMEFPSACLVLANAGKGSDSKSIRSTLATLPTGAYREIEFEEDVLALYGCFTAFVHVPLDLQSEAFGQVYVESMLAAVPGVFTLSGVACEYVRDGQNAIVVPYANSEAIARSLRSLINDPALASRIGMRARADAMREFGFDQMLSALKSVYE